MRLGFFSERNQIKKFAFTITLAILGFVLKFDDSNQIIFSELYYLLPISSILISFLWQQEHRRIIAIFRIGTFIEKFIESKVPGLNWESIGYKHPFDHATSSKVSRLFAGLDLPVLFILPLLLWSYKVYFSNRELMIVVDFFFDYIICKCLCTVYYDYKKR